MADKQKKPQNDNFFNRNPLLTFAIFSVILILLFKSILEPANTMGQGAKQHMMGAPVQKTKEISYSELKKLIEQGQVQYVAIGQKVIKAIANEGGYKVIYFANRVPGDTSLIPLLEKKGIDYGKTI